MPTHPPDPEAAIQVEELLRSAATFEAPSAPPLDLAMRAISRWHARRAQRRRLRFGLVTALSIGMGALAVTWLRGGSTPPQRIAAAAKPFGVRRPVAALDFPTVAPPSGDAEKRRKASGRGESLSSMTDPGRDPKRRRVAALQRAGAAVFVHARQHRPRPRPPKAHWEVQTVQRDVEGVLAPVWLVQADDERGELLVTPGILQIQTKPTVLDAALDSSENTVPTTEPTFVENR